MNLEDFQDLVPIFLQIKNIKQPLGPPLKTTPSPWEENMKILLLSMEMYFIPK